MKILFGMRDDGDMTEPMNIMLLSALTKREGHKTALWVIERDNLAETVKKEKPDIVAFSCITGSHYYYLGVAQELKKRFPHLLTAFGGPHFTFFPAEILRNDCIDYLCVGEGIKAWPELLSAIERGSETNKILNIVTHENALSVLEEQGSGLVKISMPGTKTSAGDSLALDRLFCRQTHLRPREENLDDLPFMDRGLVYNNTEFRHRYKRTMIASFGCPFRCAYCFEHQNNLLYGSLGRIRRWLSVDRFLDELAYVKRGWDTRFFKFYDDVFPPFPSPAEIAWHEEFCSKYPAKVGLPFHILTRCDLVVAMKQKGVNLIEDWKRAGLASITMSIESGNPFIHDHVITRNMDMREIVEAFDMALKAKVSTFPNTILAIPAPLLPRANDPDFDEEIRKLAEDLKILKQINGERISAEDVLTLVKNWFPNTRDHRKAIVGILRQFGLRHSPLEYDMESVDFTLDCLPGFAEFLTLFPYPKTRAADWCIARGDFDGDYEKLHASYQTPSPLSCYSDKEKAVIQNLALLGTFLTLFTGSKNRAIRFLRKPLQKIFVHHLSKITHPKATKLYLWLYTISKAYMHRTRVYPIKYSFREKLHFYGQMFELDIWKQEKRRKKLISRR